VTGKLSKGWNKHVWHRILHLVKFYIRDDLYQFKYCSDQIIGTCGPNHEIRSICLFLVEGALMEKQWWPKYFNGFYYPTLFKGINGYYKRCPRYQQLGRITRRDMMRLNPIIVDKDF